MRVDIFMMLVDAAMSSHNLSVSTFSDCSGTEGIPILTPVNVGPNLTLINPINIHICDLTLTLKVYRFQHP